MLLAYIRLKSKRMVVGLQLARIGNVFGEEVDGEHTGVGKTKEDAILALEKKRL